MKKIHDQQTRKELLKSKFSPISFGTSGIRALVINMTDMECYINTRGFIKYLLQINEVKKGGLIALGGDLRKSTPRIMAAVHRAIIDEGCQTLYCGFIPTPTLSFFAWKRHIPAIMVTGSHIPEDLNGIKFIKSLGEVLKEDEKDILEAVAKIREIEYSKNGTDSLFNLSGYFKKPINLPSKTEEKKALKEFKIRYTNIFPKNILKNKKIVLYEQSAVGRDLLNNIFSSFGAEVICLERSKKFIPIDTEKMPEKVLASMKKWAKKYKPFAIISTDGDSDRPILADENGSFLPGDLLGLLVSLYLKPEFVSIPVSSNDAATEALKNSHVEVTLTKIGSPYCIVAMNKKLIDNPSAKVVSWERNGGYLLGSNWVINNHTLELLPTRDSILPILISLIFATEEKVSLSTLINQKLPSRFTIANAIDNKTKGCKSYTSSLGKIIINSFSPSNTKITQLNFNPSGLEVLPKNITYPEINNEAHKIKTKLETYFNPKLGYSSISSINYIDGIRISFSNSDIVHLRPSSNAPDFRLYVTADSQKHADKIISDRLTILPKIISDSLK